MSIRVTTPLANHVAYILDACERTTLLRQTYSKIEDTTGQSKLDAATEAERLSRYKILSHQAGVRFFSPESYP